VTYSTKDFIKDMWYFLEGRRLRFTAHTILRAFSGAVEFIEPFLLGLIITFFTEFARGESLIPFYWLVFALFAAMSIRIVLRFISKYNLQRIGAELRKDLRVKAMQQLLRLDLTWHEKEKTGSKIQKINRGGNQIVFILFKFSNEWLQIASYILFGLIAFLFIDITYAIYCICVFILYAAYYSLFYSKLIQLKKKETTLAEIVSGNFHESASNITSVKSLGLDTKVLKKTTDVEKIHFKAWLASKKFSVIRSVHLLIFTVIAWAGFLLLIGHDFVQGAFAIGFILTYISYFDKIRTALIQLIWEISQFADVRISTERFMTILGADEFREKERGKVKKPSSWKELHFKNIFFSYKKKKTLKGVSFSVKKGQKVAIVGESGSGKSTITKLLLDLYHINSGEILLDALALSDIKQSHKNAFFSTVLQDSEVFDASIKENIIFGRQAKTQNMFDKIVKITQLQKFIRSLPQKEKTNIGEKGYRVSGGERQRIGIARALYAPFEVLIMDEATSSLDSKTEEKIVTAIQKEFKNKTQIIVAHRLSTIKHVDKIIVLDKGIVLEEGSHKTLLKKKGQYYKLWKLQGNKK
jgi:ABC-type multidrug transport system fused ATPase/permease subunit